MDIVFATASKLTQMIREREVSTVEVLAIANKIAQTIGGFIQPPNY